MYSKTERAADARDKIEKGGLVNKGGLGDKSKAVILGAIIAASEQMKKEPGYEDYLKSLGERSFMGFDE